MKILTAEQMREVDGITIEKLGVPGAVLMENAGIGVVRAMDEVFGPLAVHRIAIFCGKGNNGGDGFVVARQLFMRGLSPAVVLLADPAGIRGDALINYEILVKSGRAPYVVRDLNEWLALKPELLRSTLLVDAILGTGLTGVVQGFLCEILRDINDSFAGVPMVAVDIPSGMSSDAEAVQPGECLRADLTVTFTAPKAGQILSPDSERLGDLRVAPIGTPPEVYESRDDFFLNLVTPQQLAPFVAARPRASHKGDFGHVLVIAGSRGKTGAAAMAGQAALKAGAGLVTVATSESALPVVAGFFPELMTEPLPETETGGISARALDTRFSVVAGNKDVLALGPGLGTHPDTVAFVRRVTAERSVPVVLDADALNAFSGAPELLAGGKAPLVLTPHPGEMARLLDTSTSDVQARRTEVARNFARERGVFVILKGFRTLLAAPSGQVYVNPTGNPGMASGGTGDVLTGLLAGLLAQFYRPDDPEARLVQVLCAAVYLHGLAGDLARAETGEKSLVATDLVRYLPESWRKLELSAR